MLELLADALLRPAFEGEELEDLRARHIEMIKAAKDADPSELIGTYGRAFLFRRSSLWAAGDRQRDLARRHHPAGCAATTTMANFGAERLTLVFAGDVDSDRLARMAAESFSPLAATSHRYADIGSSTSPRRPARAARRFPGLDADPFLDRQRGRRSALSPPRSARSGQHAVRRAIHFDAQHGAADQVGPLLRGALGLRARQCGRRVRDPLLRADREHRARHSIWRCRRSPG